MINVKEAEAFGLLDPIEWVKVWVIIIWCLSLTQKFMVDWVNISSTDYSEFSSIIRSCMVLLNQAVIFSVKFVRRQANKVAHALARASCFHASPTIWKRYQDHVHEYVFRQF